MNDHERLDAPTVHLRTGGTHARAEASRSRARELLRRRGKLAAAVGGAVAVGAVGMVGLLSGTAAAATAGTCSDNVNVRAEPKQDARIVAVCDRGTAVQVGEKRNGFVKLENLGGWAAEQYVRTSGPAAGRAPEAAPTTSATRAPQQNRSTPTAEPTRTTGEHRTTSTTAKPTTTRPTTTTPAPADEQARQGTQDGGSEGTDTETTTPAPRGLLR